MSQDPREDLLKGAVVLQSLKSEAVKPRPDR